MRPLPPSKNMEEKFSPLKMHLTTGWTLQCQTINEKKLKGINKSALIQNIEECRRNKDAVMQSLYSLLCCQVIAAR
jgi:hypothetical protein